MANNRAEQTRRHAAVPDSVKRGLKSRIRYLVSQFKQNSKTKYPFLCHKIKGMQRALCEPGRNKRSACAAGAKAASDGLGERV